jgi:hypothetical protein
MRFFTVRTKLRASTLPRYNAGEASKPIALSAEPTNMGGQTCVLMEGDDTATAKPVGVAAYPIDFGEDRGAFYSPEVVANADEAR